MKKRRNNGKTVKEYYTDSKIEKAIQDLLDRMEDIISSETFEGYTVEIKEKEIEKENEPSMDDYLEELLDTAGQKNFIPPIEIKQREHEFKYVSYRPKKKQEGKIESNISKNCFEGYLTPECKNCSNWGNGSNGNYGCTMHFPIDWCEAFAEVIAKRDKE